MMRYALLAAVLSVMVTPSYAQATPDGGSPVPAQSVPARSNESDAEERRDGKILFSTQHDSAVGIAAEQHTPSDVLPTVKVSDQERSSLRITSYDLDLHLVPAEAREEMHATISLRNTSSDPLARMALQISGSLRWLSVSSTTPAGLRSLSFTQSPIATDADHTGYAQEAIVTPSQPLAPGAVLALSVFYAGEIRQSADRLELLGEPAERAGETDWDAIVPTSDSLATALRGFGNVLWYPVTAPTAILGDGNKLVALTQQQRLQYLSTTMRLRLTVEYTGDPPDSAIFNSEPKPLTRMSDVDDQLTSETHGLATASFAEAPIGFRIPSLFLTAQHAAPAAGQLLAVITPNAEVIRPYATAAEGVGALLSHWLGPDPLSPLTLLDHPGQRFEDGAFFAAPLSKLTTSDGIAPELVRGLTHAWFQSSAPTSLWLSEGLPEFMSLLWMEHAQGREAALAALGHSSNLFAFEEPDLAVDPAAKGQPLTQATEESFLRLKSSAVLWQLRELIGEKLFGQALAKFRHTLLLDPTLDRDSLAFQRSLERTANLDLTWFFEDWVYRDRGLPDLTIVQVNPRLLPARPGKNAGYLVSVEVRNDGDAVADVPVTIQAGALTSSQRLRIPPRAAASTRILFESSPETVQVNDGSVPELRASVHRVHVPPQPQ